MSGRAPIFVVAVLAAGCGLVSGLDSLTIDASAPDAGPDVVSDAAPSVDSQVVAADASDASDASDGGDAGRARTALQSTGACASASGPASLSLSGTSFSIELWLRLDAQGPANEADAILWNGGGALNPGWQLVVTNDSNGNKLQLCVSDSTTSSCTTGYYVTVGHLVHVVATSMAGLNTRSAALYARDVTAGDTTHKIGGSFASGPNTWPTTGTNTFTVGGSRASSSCSNMPSFTMDDFRVFNGVQSVAQMDANMSVDIQCATTGLLVDFAFNEGTGSTATDCTSKFVITLAKADSFVTSPFP